MLKILYKLFKEDRRHFEMGGERIRYTYPALVTNAIKLCRRYKLREQEVRDITRKTSAQADCDPRMQNRERKSRASSGSVGNSRRFFSRKLRHRASLSDCSYLLRKSLMNVASKILHTTSTYKHSRYTKTAYRIVGHNYKQSRSLLVHYKGQKCSVLTTMIP